MQHYGLIQHYAPGMYHILPMGQRVIEKLIRIIDREMKSVGAEKMSVPLLSMQRLWDKTGEFHAKFIIISASLN
jgi:prolyl-tRNA synthetase